MRQSQVYNQQKVCEVCTSPYIRKTRDAARWAKARYCSRKCYDFGGKLGVLVKEALVKECEMCARPMQKPAKVACSEWEKYRFCSSVCRQRSPMRTNKPRQAPNAPRSDKSVIERIMLGSHTEPMSGCWLWTRKLSKGYGVLKVNGVRVSAHRTAYELLVGPIPSGLVVDHLCATSACVNPDHLEAVTIQENSRRGRHGHIHAAVSRSPGRQLSARVQALEEQMATLMATLGND